MQQNGNHIQVLVYWSFDDTMTKNLCPNPQAENISYANTKNRTRLP
jgi:hypothetical protein